MTNDTTKDPRILAAQLACAVLKKCVKQKPAVQVKIAREKLNEPAAACESAVMTMMYMYQPPEILAVSDPMKTISESVNLLTDAYEKLITANDDQSLLRANVRWCLRMLGGLRERFKNPDKTMASGVDLVVVLVRNVVKSGNFWKTRVTDGSGEYTVITNLKDVTSDSRLAVAFLPPREVGGVVSEAMFLGSGKRTEPVGTLLREGQADAKEAAGILYDEIAKSHK
jgi:predicted RNA-binding protein with EMAP domain